MDGAAGRGAANGRRRGGILPAAEAAAAAGGDRELRRRIALTALLALLLAAAAAAIAPVRAAAPPDAAPLVGAVASVAIPVSDLDRSVRFFTDVLTFETTDTWEWAGEDAERLMGAFGLRARTARMRLGSEIVELTEVLAPQGRPLPADSRSNDGWFQHVAIVVSDMDAAYRRLRAHRVAHASSGPQTLPDWNPDAGGISAFYFKDPDGHALELIHFPAGKGDPRWQRADGRLFLGVDHTAIAVRDTEASLGFYRDRLGFRVAGASENHGTEQEHLNNVFGARVRITALRAAAGPGVELLEYLAPQDGRPYPRDTRAGDLWNWVTRLTLATPSPAAEAALRGGRAWWVSPGFVPAGEAGAGPARFRAAATVRDPDGHALLLTDE